MINLLAFLGCHFFLSTYFLEEISLPFWICSESWSRVACKQPDKKNSNKCRAVSRVQMRAATIVSSIHGKKRMTSAAYLAEMKHAYYHPSTRLWRASQFILDLTKSCRCNDCKDISHTTTKNLSENRGA
jgi:hypothetical protein